VILLWCLALLDINMVHPVSISPCMEILWDNLQIPCRCISNSSHHNALRRAAQFGFLYTSNLRAGAGHDIGSFGITIKIARLMRIL
jgi:hypothetical protein